MVQRDSWANRFYVYENAFVFIYIVIKLLPDEDEVETKVPSENCRQASENVVY